MDILGTITSAIGILTILLSLLAWLLPRNMIQRMAKLRKDVDDEIHSATERCVAMHEFYQTYSALRYKLPWQIFALQCDLEVLLTDLQLVVDRAFNNPEWVDMDDARVPATGPLESIHPTSPTTLTVDAGDEVTTLSGVSISASLPSPCTPCGAKSDLFPWIVIHDEHPKRVALTWDALRRDCEDRDEGHPGRTSCAGQFKGEIVFDEVIRLDTVDDDERGDALHSFSAACIVNAQRNAVKNAIILAPAQDMQMLSHLHQERILLPHITALRRCQMEHRPTTRIAQEQAQQSRIYPLSTRPVSNVSVTSNPFEKWRTS
ncbi:hypothetical protein EVG20_g11396 [Dentipellis fragilis]|uniref:Uncharacterized protein n=1 Tax=Dentipellis fragilis TaxID=205917 RepID=A0A4Y9XMT0_9AGAM|nr:hypothetical protein EVG20_g11396 [Dentipellis fragilis]